MVFPRVIMFRSVLPTKVLALKRACIGDDIIVRWQAPRDRRRYLLQLKPHWEKKLRELRKYALAAQISCRNLGRANCLRRAGEQVRVENREIGQLARLER